MSKQTTPTPPTTTRNCWTDPRPDDLLYVRYNMRVVLVTNTTVVYALDSGEVHAIAREDWASKASLSGQRVISRGE